MPSSPHGLSGGERAEPRQRPGGSGNLPEAPPGHPPRTPGAPRGQPPGRGRARTPHPELRPAPGASSGHGLATRCPGRSRRGPGGSGRSLRAGAGRGQPRSGVPAGRPPPRGTASARSAQPRRGGGSSGGVAPSRFPPRIALGLAPPLPARLPAAPHLRQPPAAASRPAAMPPAQRRPLPPGPAPAAAILRRSPSLGRAGAAGTAHARRRCGARATWCAGRGRAAPEGRPAWRRAAGPGGGWRWVSSPSRRGLGRAVVLRGTRCRRGDHV